MKAALATLLGLGCGAVGLTTAVVSNGNHALADANHLAARANRDLRLALDVLDADVLSAQAQLRAEAWLPPVEPEPAPAAPLELEEGLN